MYPPRKQRWSAPESIQQKSGPPPIILAKFNSKVFEKSEITEERSRSKEQNLQFFSVKKKLRPKVEITDFKTKTVQWKYDQELAKVKLLKIQ